MVNHDLVLRTQVDDAELLIFPSSKLLEQFQRKMFKVEVMITSHCINVGFLLDRDLNALESGYLGVVALCTDQ